MCPYGQQLIRPWVIAFHPGRPLHMWWAGLRGWKAQHLLAETHTRGRWDAFWEFSPGASYARCREQGTGHAPHSEYSFISNKISALINPVFLKFITCGWLLDVFPPENQKFQPSLPSGYSQLLNRVAGHPTPATLRRFGAARGTAAPFGAASDAAVAAAMLPSLL